MSIRGRVLFLICFGTFWMLVGLFSMQKVSANPMLQFLVGGFCWVCAAVVGLKQPRS